MTRIERDIAQRLIDREHPLRDTLIWITLPFLRPCRRRFKRFDPVDDNVVEESESSVPRCQSMHDFEREIL